MSINAICAALADICDGLTVDAGNITLTLRGIDPPPAQLSTAKLPCVYVLAGDSEQEWGSDFGVETRRYRLQCVIEAKEQATRETKELQTRALIVALRDHLAGYPHLGTNGVINALVTSDTGQVIIQDAPNQEYIGFETMITVTEQLSRTYAAHE